MQLAELAAAVLASEATLGQQHQEDCLLLMTRLLDDPSYPARRAAAYLLPAASQLCADQVISFRPECELTETMVAWVGIPAILHRLAGGLCGIC